MKIAIDGTASSGKGTLGKNLSRMFNFDYLDTDNGKYQSIPIRLNKFPDFSKNIRWEPKTISYLLKK